MATEARERGAEGRLNRGRRQLLWLAIVAAIVACTRWAWTQAWAGSVCPAHAPRPALRSSAHNRRPPTASANRHRVRRTCAVEGEDRLTAEVDDVAVASELQGRTMAGGGCQVSVMKIV